MNRLTKPTRARPPTVMEEQCARAGYEMAIRRNAGLTGYPVDDPIHAWDNQSDVLKEDWYAITRAIFEQVRQATPAMLTPIACLIAPEDLPEGVTEHPNRLAQCTAAVIKAWGAAIDAASPPGPK